MRYASGHKEQTRAKIVKAAGKVFRRDGFHAAGVDKVMEEAGLTAGGFYAHFASKSRSWPRHSSLPRPTWLACVRKSSREWRATRGSKRSSSATSPFGT